MTGAKRMDLQVCTPSLKTHSTHGYIIHRRPHGGLHRRRYVSTVAGTIVDTRLNQ